MVMYLESMKAPTKVATTKQKAKLRKASSSESKNWNPLYALKRKNEIIYDGVEEQIRRPMCIFIE